MSTATTGPEGERLAALRRDYSGKPLHREDFDPDPFAQFQTWFHQAQEAKLLEVNAMTLSTADAKGRVTSRTVLLKAYDPKGFVFFTNYKSAKARQIAHNPQVALLMPWLALERQVCITGRAEKISTAASFKYFASRPFASRIGAWVSAQSEVISSRRILEMKFDEMKRKFANGEVPLPDAWGGYRVVPDSIEFWQGSASRLHDRFLYSREADDAPWTLERLSP